MARHAMDAPLIALDGGADTSIVFATQQRRVEFWLFVTAWPIQTTLATLHDEAGGALILSLDEELRLGLQLGSAKAVEHEPVTVQLCRWSRVRVRCKPDGVVSAGDTQLRAIRPFDSIVSLTLHGARLEAFVCFARSRPAWPRNSPAIPTRWQRPFQTVQSATRHQERCAKSPTASLRVARELRPGLLLCHDYKGNFLSTDSCVDTVWNPTDVPYVFTHWCMVSGVENRRCLACHLIIVAD